MGRMIFFAVFCLLIASVFFTWQRMGGTIPSWGGLYEESAEEKALAQQVTLKLNEWRSARSLSQLRTDESLCQYARRHAKEVAETATRDGFQLIVNENTVTIQASYQEIYELAGTVTTTPFDLIQSWADQSADRRVMESTRLTHHCTRCLDTTCGIVIIRALQ